MWQPTPRTIPHVRYFVFFILQWPLFHLFQWPIYLEHWMTKVGIREGLLVELTSHSFLHVVEKGRIGLWIDWVTANEPWDASLSQKLAMIDCVRNVGKPCVVESHCLSVCHCEPMLHHNQCSGSLTPFSIISLHQMGGWDFVFNTSKVIYYINRG